MPHLEHLLIPGRHHALTNFQHTYIQDVLSGRNRSDLDGKEVDLAQDPNLIWAITSANHSNTRRNPLPGHRREVGIEAFCADLPARSFTYPINDIGHTERFADFVVKEIEVQSRGQFHINPDNTAIVCSTPEVIEMYEKLGYRILPAELAVRGVERYICRRPWDLILAIADAGPDWRQDPTYLKEVHSASRRLLERYKLGDLIVEVHKDPLLGDEGDITDTRNYDVYRESFEAGARRKYDLVSKYINNGRIVDIGCATGEVIKLMAEDPNLRESDLYGIEASRRLYTICEQRRQNGDFAANENVFFYQRNIMSSPIFPDNSVNTTTTIALTHEIESYLGHEQLLQFIRKVYEQTALGGVYINSDVIGPENRTRKVILQLNDQDGYTESWEEIDAKPKLTKDELDSLSTLGKFRRFSRDFRAAEDEQIEFREATELGPNYVEISLGDASEFMSKKDYTDNWYSEMHERFCFWSFEEWRAALTAAGFKVSEESRAYRNEWIVENSYKGRVALFTRQDGRLEPLKYPDTNILLIAKK